MAGRARKRKPRGGGGGAKLALVPRGPGGVGPTVGKRPDTETELEARLERVRRALYGIYGDLRYFTTSPASHRERLRQKLDWPDVGHITSLARSLVEEGRFADWVRFNGLVKSA